MEELNMVNPSKNLKLQDSLLGMIHSYRITQLIYVAAKLGIADLLNDGPKTAADLAVATGTHGPSLYRVMRALTSLGIFNETKTGFHMTPLGTLLQKDVIDSVCPVAIMRGEECNWGPWGELLYGVQTGKSAFEKVFGMDLFEYYTKHPEAGTFFDQGMSIFSEIVSEAIIESYDFSTIKKVVDIGGGNGALLVAILKKYPEMQGVLYDLPHVVQKANGLVESGGISNRVEIIGGEFFQSIPSGGDIYILKKIIHDWDDERATTILNNCRQVMESNSRILLVEMVIQPQTPIGKVNDIHMMVVTPGGRERTAEEFRILLANSGFQLSRIIETANKDSIIEGMPN